MIKKMICWIIRFYMICWIVSYWDLGEQTGEWLSYGDPPGIDGEVIGRHGPQDGIYR
jgi:hypothetical protein